MSFFRYLRDRAVAIYITALSLLIVVLVLRGVGTEDSIVALVSGILLVAAVLRLLVGYVPRSEFWNLLVASALVPHEASPLAVADLVDEPRFLEGQLAWEVMDALAQDYRARVDVIRAEGADYRDFVEAWVHEVKTPIAAARLVCDNNPGQASSTVSRELGRIDGYVEQALYYARSGSLDRDYVIRRVEVSALVHGAVRAHARSLIDQQVSVRTDGLDMMVFADVKWVAFVLGQLIENAAKYRAPREWGRDEALLCFAAVRYDEGLANERVVLKVTDNGRGIPASDLPRVFDKGFVGENGRLTTLGKSTGIGLFLVKRLCDKMGLSVGMESVEGSWTRVSITFPTNRMHYVDRLD